MAARVVSPVVAARVVSPVVALAGLGVVTAGGVRSVTDLPVLAALFVVVAVGVPVVLLGAHALAGAVSGHWNHQVSALAACVPAWVFGAVALAQTSGLLPVLLFAVPAVWLASVQLAARSADTGMGRSENESEAA